MISFFLANALENVECARCGAVIDGPVALAVVEAAGRYLDLKCGSEINPAALLHVIDSARLPIPAADALRAFVEHRLAAERDANRTSPKSAVTVEQLRDHKGRPRVRALVFESGPGAAHGATSYWGLRSLCRLHHLWSSTREYALVWDSKVRDSRSDPAQPIAAAIYWHSASAKVPAFNGKLVEWRALGLASPVIVIAGDGASDAARRDDVVSRLRGLLAKSGFAADDAPVVYALDNDAATLEALALALDEQATKTALNGERRKELRVMATVTDLFEGERDDALAQTIIGALKRFGRAPPEEKATLVERMVAFARRSPLEAAPMLRGIERYNVVLERAALEAIIEGILSHPQKLPAQTAGWLSHWLRWRHPREELSAMVRAAIDRGPKKKAAKLSSIADALRIAASTLQPE